MNLGYTQEPLDSACGFLGADFLEHLKANVTGPRHWEQLAAYSDPSWTPIPIDRGQSFRLIVDSDSDAIVDTFSR
ncbi:MAG: hypothetical protein LAP85_26200 [Acidobacteriia bacterium]|nr:hypothetical protein [Terriglobia bacterium]